MGTKTYNAATDMITFSRASGGTALRRVGYGTELVTNGTFDDESAWSIGATSPATVTKSGGKLTLYSPAGESAFANQDVLTVGKLYQVTFDLVHRSGTVKVQLGSGATGDKHVKTFNLSGSHTVNLLAGGSDGVVYFSRQGSCDVDIDNISVKEVTFDQADGTLELFNHPTDIPRIEYDAAGAVKGLLIEEQRTNSFLNSDSPETQVVAVTPNTPHTLSFDGGSSVVDLDETIASNAVDVFVYDTSKDSDGGAWRTGTLAQASSWYNETLNTATRGSRREFPAVAVIVAESNKVTIYDGDDPSLPMWREMTGTARPFGTSLANTIWINSGNTSLAALNGKVVLGTDGSTNPSNGGGAYIFDFLSDRADQRYTSYGVNTGYGASPLSSVISGTKYEHKLPTIVNNSVNDIAMTVLPSAPIDAATGLPVPTIAVATDGGVSVIKDDGTVVSKDWAPNNIFQVAISGTKVATSGGASTAYWGQMVWDYEADTSYLMGSRSFGIGLGANSSHQRVLFGLDSTDYIGRYYHGGQGLGKIEWDNLSNSLVLGRTSTYNTGWMNGDIKGAFLSDTDDTDLVGGELVTNGDFATDSDWIKVEFSISGGVAVPNSAATTCVLEQRGLGMVTGQTYTLEFDVSGRTVGNIYPRAGSYSNITSLNSNANGRHSFTFVNAFDIIQFVTNVGFDGTLDNISVKLADADRSVNANPLTVNGTVTKTAVATGADLVGYSGFSASNYLEQPYNSDLDFGTGDFCVMGWMKTAGNEVVVGRFDKVSGTPNWDVRVLGGELTFVVNGSNKLAPSVTVTSDTWVSFCVIRDNGVLSSYVNGVLDATTANTQDLTNTVATLGVGARVDAVPDKPFAGSLALLRISATAPSPEQIAKIYNDEKVLFQAGAQATLYGTSDAVTALAHDDDTGLLHVGTSAGRSVFNGLNRINNTTTGVTTAISAVNGIIGEQ